MENKILLLEFKQPNAHYREAKIKQDDYISTYNLPSPTTIAGMISYASDKRFDKELKLSVVGKYKIKRIDFIRGEEGNIISDFEKFIIKELRYNKKNKLENNIDFPELFNYVKSNSKNRVMNFEILQDIELKIFIDSENKEDLQLIKESFENPSKYLSLGRKEDFIFPIKKGEMFVKEIVVNEVYIEDKKQAIKQDLLVKNTYIPVELIKSGKNENKYNDILNRGVYYSIPKKYKDLLEDKKNREMIFGNYIYISNEGAYLKDIKLNIYESENEKILFKWLVGDSDE
ncbi:CRISPR-associated Cas5t family protein [Oceanotoga teriensis]|uniref:CRISPR-associated Cas5t family protein n=1 Tax=Oceanotoga teriensis TaxID=515440 RepID=A0AA45C726_9BACT|nr:CRISPR-associated protein Cas5 [Oceanotoga teriensis]PWJ93308.1 CRISPR-associated Cas5t family protein [Oceanotoga teriensis]